MTRASKRDRGRKAPPTPKRTPQDLSQPVERLTWTAGEEDDGLRLDRFLSDRLPWRSRSSIVELLGEEQVLRNGSVVRKKSARVQGGDVVEVLVPPPAEPHRHAQLAEQLAQAVLHDDDDLLAVTKPPGLVVHPVGRIRQDTLIQGLHWLFRHGARREDRDRDGGVVIPRICHRLDKGTSGVLVVAKNRAARSAIQHIFEGRQVEKEYLAVVAGVVEPDSGEVDLPLGPDEEAEIDLLMTVREDGAPSRTTFRVEERFAAASLVRFRIHTGRQHQIRVHARALGHPVWHDLLYGSGPQPGIARQALHAERLAFPHPVSGEPLELRAPLPADLVGLLEELRAG